MAGCQGLQERLGARCMHPCGAGAWTRLQLAAAKLCAGAWTPGADAPPCCRPAAEAFRACPLFIGGPVTKNLLHVLHARRDVEGALEIIEVGCRGAGCFRAQLLYLNPNLPGRLWAGGCICQQALQLGRAPFCEHGRLHSTCMPSLQGVYAGGVESASELVRRGEASPSDFMLLSGYSGWGPWQLQQVRRAGAGQQAAGASRVPARRAGEDA